MMTSESPGKIRGLDVLATHFRFAMTLGIFDCWKMVWGSYGVTYFDVKKKVFFWGGFQVLDQVMMLMAWWLLWGSCDLVLTSLMFDDV